jgi:hypothetical protein
VARRECYGHVVVVGEANFRRVLKAYAAYYNCARARLAPESRMTLDSVRVIGNETVHPGTMDMRDDHDTAIKLFGLANLIVDETGGIHR